MEHASSAIGLPLPSRFGSRRFRRQRWVRPNDFRSATSLLTMIPSVPRAALARLTTRLIDDIDGSDEHEMENTYD